MASKTQTTTPVHGISIVIPAYNEEKALPETLSFINDAREQFHDLLNFPTEVIVVDNASTDKTRVLAEGLGAQVIAHAERNIASARNAGIKASSYSIVATMDADVFVPPDTFVRIWRAMETGRYVGGGARMGTRTEKTHLRVFTDLLDLTILALSNLSVGMFFFWKSEALAVGGFPESHLVAEDMAFAKILQAHAANQGKSFLNLRSVKILKFDRKEASFSQLLGNLYLGAKVYFGAKVKKEDLGYWYDPKR